MVYLPTKLGSLWFGWCHVVFHPDMYIYLIHIYIYIAEDPRMVYYLPNVPLKSTIHRGKYTVDHIYIYTWILWFRGIYFGAWKGNAIDLKDSSKVAGSISNAITAALSPLVPENLNDGHIVSLVLKKQWVLSPGNSKNEKTFLLFVYLNTFLSHGLFFGGGGDGKYSNSNRVVWCSNFFALYCCRTAFLCNLSSRTSFTNTGFSCFSYAGKLRWTPN